MILTSAGVLGGAVLLLILVVVLLAVVVVAPLPLLPRDDLEPLPRPDCLSESEPVSCLPLLVDLDLSRLDLE